MIFFLNIYSSWKIYLTNRKNFNELVFTFFISICTAYVFRKYLVFVENWDHNLGVFNDPFFLSNPIDFSIPIFLMTYGSMFFFFFYNANKPSVIIKLFQVVVILLFLRAITLYFFRFDSDPNMIILKDPFLNTFIYQLNENTGLYNQHDLFFSGHTANLFLVSILYSEKRFKYFFLLITFLIATFLVLQRAHYSIDVLFAPLFSLIALFVQKKIKSYQ